MFYDKIINIIDIDIQYHKMTDETKDLLEDPKYYQYFFKQLELSGDEIWIPILVENGLLSFDRRYGDFFIPLHYIRLVLKKSHQFDETIYRLLFEWKGQLNDPKLDRFNFLRIANICALLDAEFAIKTVDTMFWCLEMTASDSRMVISEFEPFVRKLKERNAVKEILRVFMNIFKFTFQKEEAFSSKEIRFKYDQYWVVKVFEEIKEIIQSDPQPYFRHLVEEYNNILLEVHPKKDDLDWNDYSVYTRPAIEKSKYNLGVSTQDTIITLLRDIIDLINDVEAIESILGLLLEQEYPIFHRLAMHLYGERFEVLSSKYEEIFINSKMFSDYSVSHELWEVLRKCYSKLKHPEIIDEILEKGEQGLREDLKPEKIEHYNLMWKYSWLKAIQANIPTEGRAQEIKEIEKKLDYEPEHPEFMAGYSESRVGYDSPCTIEELASKSWEEIKQYLLDFDETKVERKFSFRPENEGLRRIFKEVISQRRDDFIKNIRIFQDTRIKNLYLGTITAGIFENEKIYYENYINKIIDYLDWILDKVSGSDLCFNGKGNMALSNAFHDFFIYIFNLKLKEDDQIPDTIIVNVISLFCKFYEVSYNLIVREFNPLNGEQTFINSTSGWYWQAWLALNFLQSRQENRAFLIPEFRDLLTRSVGKDVYVNYLLGRYTANFFYLDSTWIMQHFDEIFPTTPDMKKLWDSAMRAFLWSRSLRDEIFGKLLPHIEALCRETLDEREQAALGDRIGFYYLRKATHRSCHKNLIKKICNIGKEKPAIFSSIINFMVRSYNEENNGKEIRKYIRYRYKPIKEDPENYKNELNAIIYTYKCFPKMGKRDYLIIRKAFEISNLNTRSFEIIDVYKYFLEKERYSYLIQLMKLELKNNTYPVFHEEDYSEIFRSLYRSGNLSVQRQVSILINEIGKKGFYEYKPIYADYLAKKFDI